MKVVAWLFALSLVIPGEPARASALREGNGLMYDQDSAFMLDAPKGWVLDTSAARGSGVCAVFYPAGSSWEKADVVCYVNTRRKTPRLKTIADAVAADMDDMHAHGSPASRAERVGDIKLRKGAVAEIWNYRGDTWGNQERTAFIPGPGSIAAIVMSARSEKALESALPAFAQLVASYQYFGPVKVER